MRFSLVECQKERRVTAAGLLHHPELQKLWESTSREQLIIIESPWMPMSLEDRIEQPSERMVNRHNLHLRGGCKTALNTIVVTPDSEVGFCCGLTREKIPELNAPWKRGFLGEQLEEAGKDFMKIWLFVDGPEKILAWAASKNPEIDWENRYAHHCHACLRVFSDSLIRETISKHYRERVDDVLMRYSLGLRKQEYLEAEDAILQVYSNPI